MHRATKFRNYHAGGSGAVSGFSQRTALFTPNILDILHIKTKL